MFVFEENYTFDWPVVVAYPAEGGLVERTFTARFAMLPEDALRGIVPEGGDWLAAERALVGRMLAGWSGIILPDGSDLAVTDENRARLIGQRPIREAVTRAYLAAMSPQGIRAKN